MSPKLLIVVAVVLVVLFLVSVGIGSGGGLPGLSVEGVVGALENLLPSARVEIADINADPESCLNRQLQRLVVPQLGQCSLTVAPSSVNVRSLTFTSDSALRVRTRVEPVEGETMTIRAELPAEPQPGFAGGPPPRTDQIKLDIYGSGGTILIDQCVPDSGSACVIDLS